MSRKALYVAKTIVGCVLVSLSLYIVCVFCYIYTKPWQIQIPTFNCSITRSGATLIFLSDKDGHWSIGSNILLIDVTETMLYGLDMSPAAFNRLDYLKEPSFFILEKGESPKTNLSYNDFITYLRAHSVSTIDLQPPFSSSTKEKISNISK